MQSDNEFEKMSWLRRLERKQFKVISLTVVRDNVVCFIMKQSRPMSLILFRVLRLRLGPNRTVNLHIPRGEQSLCRTRPSTISLRLGRTEEVDQQGARPSRAILLLNTSSLSLGLIHHGVVASHHLTGRSFVLRLKRHAAKMIISERKVH